MEELNESGPGPMLYGFYKVPVLDSVTTWSETLNVTVQVDSHQASLFLQNLEYVLEPHMIVLTMWWA